MAKAPIPGRCKTRLTTGCTAARAARIHFALLERAVAAACAQSTDAVTLVCAPSIRHPAFRRLARAYPLRLMRQARGPLGQRMHAALRSELRRHRGVVLMGSDQPALADAWFDSARRALYRRGAAWLGPAGDGGYWAIGLSRAEARVFHGPRWSTPRVTRQTRRALARVTVEHHEWPRRPDIDTWRDWMTLNPGLRRSIARDAALPGRAAFRRTMNPAWARQGRNDPG